MTKLTQNLFAFAVAVLIAGTSLTAVVTVPADEDGTTTYASATLDSRELA